MAELFKAYEKDFSKHLANANKKLSTVSSTPNSDQVISEAKSDIEEAETTLRLMENEIQKMAPNVSSQYQNRFIRQQESFQKVRQSINNELTRKNKSELMGRPSVSNPRDKLLVTNEIIQDSGESLERTLKKGLEAEAMAYETKGALLNQRKKIQNINDKVGDVGTNLNAANRTINVMDKRRIGIKILYYFLILLLMIGLAISLYIKLKK